MKTFGVTSPADRDAETRFWRGIAESDRLDAITVYADWLLERGDRRGDVITAHLAAGNPVHPQIAPYIEIPYAIRSKQPTIPEPYGEWVSAVSPFLAQVSKWTVNVYHGMLYGINVGYRDLAAIGPALSALPFAAFSVDLEGVSSSNAKSDDIEEELAKAFAVESLSQVTNLRITGSFKDWDPDEVYTLMTVHIGDELLSALARSTVLGKIERLCVSDGGVTANGMHAFARGDFSTLRTLILRDNRLTLDAVEELARAPWIEHLQQLDLRANYLTKEDCVVVRASKLSAIPELLLGVLS